MSHPLKSSELKKLLIALEKELHSLLSLLDMDEAKIVELDQSRMGRISRIDAILHQQLAKSRGNEAQIRFEVLKKTKARLLEAPEFFGFCEECDERIPLGRLLLRPEALFCVPCLSG